jgi:choline-sulfatase
MSRDFNLIVIKTDQQRWDTLGCQGHPVVRTPNLDRLAGQGSLCENAFTVSPLCVPSRASFFTGQYPHHAGHFSNRPEHHIQSGQWSFLEPLREHGYVTGISGKNHAFRGDDLLNRFDYCEEYESHGKLRGDITAGDRAVSAFRHREGLPGVKPEMLYGGLIEHAEPFPPEQCLTHRIAQDGIRFLEQNRARRFFLHLSFPDPHWPQVVCEPYHSMYNPEKIELEAWPMDWTGHPFAHYVQSQALGFDHYTLRQRQRILATYLGQVTFIDDAVGMLLARLEALGLRERTLIVFTSDHGDFAGRYGLVEMTKGFQDCLIRVPLIISLPGATGDRKVKASVDNIDVFPTLFDFLGIPIEVPMPGKSFLRQLQGGHEPHRETLFAEVGDPRQDPPPPIPLAEYAAYARRQEERKGCFWFTDYTINGRAVMIREENWKYCYYTGDAEELYDLAHDPLELHNLALTPAFQDQRHRLRSRLKQWLLESGDTLTLPD